MQNGLTRHKSHRVHTLIQGDLVIKVQFHFGGSKEEKTNPRICRRRGAFMGFLRSREECPFHGSCA